MKREKTMKKTVLCLAVIAALVAMVVILAPLLVVGESHAATQSNRISILCINCTGTGAQPQNRVHGGLNVITASCTGTFPDALDIESRDDDRHPWLPVQGVDTFTANARQTNLFGFAENSAVRVVITDVADAFVCFVTTAALPK